MNKLLNYIYRLTPNRILRRILPKLKSFHFIEGTYGTQVPISFDMWYDHKVKGHMRSAYWPIHKNSYVVNPHNIYCGIETSPGYSPGNYIQAIGKIYVGDYTQIAPNVGIISSNHDVYDSRKHIEGNVYIGKYCWIGFGAVILPGVKLGDFTIVGAGSVVTKSFPKGHCVIGGVPAKQIKELDYNKVVRHQSENEYNGYLTHGEFLKYSSEKLKWLDDFDH